MNNKIMPNTHKIIAAFAATIMIVALALSLTPVAAQSSATVDPEKVPKDERVLLDFTITNDTSWDIENIIIQDQAGNWSGPIGGEQTAENLKDAADHLDTVTGYFDDAYGKMIDALESAAAIGPSVESAAGDDGLTKVHEYAQYEDGLWTDTYNGWFNKAALALDDAANELQKEDIDMTTVVKRMESAGKQLQDAASKTNSPYLSDNLTNAATALGNAENNLDNGTFTVAAACLDNVSIQLNAVANKVADNENMEFPGPISDGFDQASSDFADASDDLADTADYLKEAGREFGAYVDGEHAIEASNVSASFKENATDNYVTISVDVTNVGDFWTNPADNVVLHENLKAGDDNVQNIAMGYIAPGESKTITFDKLSQTRLYGSNVYENLVIAGWPHNRGDNLALSIDFTDTSITAVSSANSALEKENIYHITYPGPFPGTMSNPYWDYLHPYENASGEIWDAAMYVEKANAQPLDNVISALKNTSKYMANSGSYLAGKGYVQARARTGTVDNQNVFKAGKYLAFSGYRAGYGLESAGDNLGRALGGKEIADAGEALQASGDNLAGNLNIVSVPSQIWISKENFKLATAAGALDQASSDLTAGASAMENGADDFAPAGWKLYPPSLDSNLGAGEVLLEADSNDYAIEGGESETFTFLWTSSTSDTTFKIYAYQAGDYPDQSFTTEVSVDVVTSPPELSALVTQEGVEYDNLVGDTYQDNGMATLTIESDRELKDMGKIELRDNDSGDNLIAPIESDELETVDNTTYSYDFEVGEWDENSPVQIHVKEWTGIYEMENSGGSIGEFVVDTSKPLMMNDPLTDPTDYFVKKAQTGTTDVFWADNYDNLVLIGKLKDNWTPALKAMKNYAASLEDTPDNTSIPEVLKVRAAYNGEEAVGEERHDDNFQVKFTLPNGQIEKMSFGAEDWTGNTKDGENIENIMIDTQSPTIEFDTIAGKDFTDEVWINDNTPKISLTIKDPGYPEAGLGVARDNLKVQVHENTDFDSGSQIGSNLENADAWDPATGTFENIFDNAGNGLAEDTYHLYAWASDNLNASENATISFKVDTTDPEIEDLVSDVEVEDPSGAKIGTSATTNKSKLTYSGEADEKGSTIYLKNDDGDILGQKTLDKDEKEWEITVTLPGGRTYVYVQEEDMAGNTSEKQLAGQMIVDTNAPTIEFSQDTKDKDGTETSRTTLLLEATITDDVATYDEIATQLSGSAYMTPESGVTIAEDGTISREIPLREGVNTITLIADDDAGNRAVKTITITRTVTPWTMYATIAAIIAIILAAIAILRRT